MRVDGALAVSRAMGDFHFKPHGMEPSKCKVSVVPEVQTIEGCSSGDWILLACDGIFDVMENEEVRDFVEDHPARANGSQVDGGQICVDLLKLCLDKGSKDNCTACFVQFGDGPARSKSSELLQGPWRGASPEVQSKYAEFFRDHGFEAEASEMVQGRRLSGSKTKVVNPSSPESSNATTRNSLSSITRVLQAVRSTRAIQSAWRARKSSEKEAATASGTE